MINRKALILKAAIAAVTAIAITFIQVHNGLVGLVAVLSFATGILAAEVWDALTSGDSMLKGTVLRVAGGMIFLIGALSYSSPGADAFSVFVLDTMLIGYALTAISMFRAYKFGWGSAEGRDNIVLAVIHFSLAVLFALDSFGINKLGEVPAVGFFGAYAAIVAVLWGLRAFDPKRSS